MLGKLMLHHGAGSPGLKDPGWEQPMPSSKIEIFRLYLEFTTESWNFA